MHRYSYLHLHLHLRAQVLLPFQVLLYAPEFKVAVIALKVGACITYTPT